MYFLNEKDSLFGCENIKKLEIIKIILANS
jgi:hypothetical protein